MVVDLESIAKGAGIKNVINVVTLDKFERAIEIALGKNELHVIVAKVSKEPVTDLVRKRSNGFEDRINFVRYIEKKKAFYHVSP